MSALTELGQHVVWAPHAAAALDRLERGEVYDLIFSDIVMPGMNGIELAQIIRQRWPSFRVVLTSGYSHVLSEPNDHRFELIQKPYSMDNLVTLLSSSQE
jgi:CheY-like chemotaxis protein